VFLIIALVLFVVWVVGFGFFRAVVGGAIHIILLIAVIALVWHFVAGHSGRGAAGPTNATGAIDPLPRVRGGLA
jgi:hypothetical protein